LKQRIRTLVVNDESSTRDTIRAFLQNRAEFEIADECSSGLKAIEMILKQNLDLVFLDAQMPDLGAFEIIEKIGFNEMPPTILMSADERSAFRAFSAQVVDYLLKPFNQEDLESALERAKTHMRRRKLDETSRQLFDHLEDLYGTYALADRIEKVVPTKPDYLMRLAVKSGERIFLQNVDEIDWIGVQGDYMHLHVKGKSHLLRETMNALAAKLDPKKFIRVHRSIIINIEQAKDFQPLFKGEYIITLKDGKRLKTSRSYFDAIREILNQ
jgi:two-component system LytT family response regulator